MKLPSKLWRQLREESSQAIRYFPGQIETARAGPRWGWRLRGAIGMIMMMYRTAALVGFPLGALRGWFQSGR